MVVQLSLTVRDHCLPLVSSQQGLPVSKTTRLLDTKRTSLIPSCEVPHRPGTGHGVITGSTPSIFLRIPKNTFLLGAGSRGDSRSSDDVQEAWICKMDSSQKATGCNALVFEKQLPMKKRGRSWKLKRNRCDVVKKNKKKVAKHWRNKIHAKVFDISDELFSKKTSGQKGKNLLFEYDELLWRHSNKKEMLRPEETMKDIFCDTVQENAKARFWGLLSARP